MSDSCDACGEDVAIGGGIAGIFDSDTETTGGMTLELADGTEHFLCFDCIDRLPDDREVVAEDVAALTER
jgi:DNA/RNA-binding domain of Phe-tRNA-synthetase-like protein